MPSPIFDLVMSGATSALKPETKAASQPADELFDALIMQESGGRQLDKSGAPITSKAGAIGIAQVMPGTAPEAAALAGLPWDEVKYRGDAEYNKALGKAYFDKQLTDFGDIPQALAAYNAGPGAVRRALSVAQKSGQPDAWLSYLPEETRNYVPAIMGRSKTPMAAGAPAAAAVTAAAVSKPAPRFAPGNEDAVAAGPGVKGPTAGDFGREFAASFLTGIGSIGQFVGEGAALVANAVTGTEEYAGKNLLDPAAQGVRAGMTEGGKAALQAAEIKGDILDPSTWVLPGTTEGWAMIAANGLGSVASSLLPMVGPAARVASLAKAGKAAEAAAAARTATVIGAASGGAQTGGSAAQEVRDTTQKTVDAMTHEQLLAGVPVYAQALGAGADEATARAAVVNGAARLAGGLASVAGAAGGAFNAKIIEGLLLKNGISKALGATGGGVAGRAAVGAAGGVVAEGGQEGAEKFGQNVGENIATGRPALEDATRNTAGDVFAGALTGGLIGGPVGAVSTPQNPAAMPAAIKAQEPNTPLSKAATAGNIATEAVPQPATPVPVDPAQRLTELEGVGQQGGVFTPEQQQEYEALKGAREATPGAVPDEIGPKALAARDALRANRGLLDALRADTSPVKPQALLKDLSVASSKSAQPAMREQALARVEMAMEWAAANPAAEIEADLDSLPGLAKGEDRPQAPRPTAAQLQAGVGRDAELLAERDGQRPNQVGNRTRDEADRREQAAIDIESAPAAPPEALDRAVALRQQAASLRRQADELDARPGAAGTPGTMTERDRAGIDEQRQANLERNMRAPASPAQPTSPAAETDSTAEGLARVEALSLGAKDTQRKAEDNPRQVMIDRALRNVEERGGVASPAEARIFQEAGVGKPYDRVDESLADELSTDEKLTQATGIALGRAPRESTRQGQQSEADLVAQEQRDRSDSRMQALAAERKATQAGQPAAREAAAAPTADEVIAALKTIPALRTAEQKSLVDIARRNYTAEQMRVMNDAAVNPANLSATDKLQLQQMREARKSEERVAEPQALPDVAIPAGEGPAFLRKRKAQIAAAAGQGYETVERRDGVFVMRNAKTGAEVRLSGRADAALAREAIRKMVDERAHAAATSPKNDRKEPSWAQIDAINWKKGDPIPLNGVTVRIENPVGSVRRARPDAPVQWKTTMKHHYGEIAGTKGVDGDPVDVFVGPNPASSKIWVIDQVTEDGKLDEHKVMFGFDSEAAARAGYLSNFSSGWKGLGKITEMTQEEFRAWIKDQGATMAPAAEAAPTAAPAEDIATAVEPETGSFTVRMDGKDVKFERRGVDAMGEAESPERDGKAIRISKKSAALIKAIAQSLGKKVVFFADVNGVRPGDGFVIPNDPDTIYINEVSTINPLAVMGHEFMHTLRRTNPEAWNAMAAVVKTRVTNPYGFRRDYYGAEEADARADGALNEDQAGELEELVSDLGGNLMSDEGFWADVFEKIRADNGDKAKGIIAKLIATLQSLMMKVAEVVKGPQYKANRFVEDLDAIKAAYRDGLAAYLQKTGESRAGMQAEVLRSRQRMSADDILEEYFDPRDGGRRIEYRGKEAYHAMKKLPYGQRKALERDLGIKSTGDWLSDINAVRAAIAARAGFPGYESAPPIRVYSENGNEPKLVKAGNGYIQVLPDVPDTEDVRTLYVNWSNNATPAEVIAAARAESRVTEVNRIFYGPESGVTSGMEVGAISRDPSRWAEAKATALAASARATTLEQSLEFGKGFAKTLAAKQDGKFVVGVFEDTGAAFPSRRVKDQPAAVAQPGGPGQGASGAYSRSRPRGLADRLKGFFEDITRSPERGIHFSKRELTSINGAYYGTGLKGAEAERLRASNDSRLKTRAYFYIDEGNGVRPEAGVGGYAHEAQLPRLYDAKANAEKLWNSGDLNGTESRILDAGYAGYFVKKHETGQGLAVVIGDASKALPATRVTDPKIQSGVPNMPPETLSKGLMSKEMGAVEVTNIPGAKMRAGILTIPADSREQANAEMERIGSPIRFSAERIDADVDEVDAVRKKYEGTDKWMKAPNGSPTNLTERQWLHVRTPSFKKWFGDWEKFADGSEAGVWNDDKGEVSKVVGRNGEPLIVYHGTDHGGFSEFQRPGGKTRGDLGIFTTDDAAMAMSYVHRRRARMIGRSDINNSENDESTPGVYALFLNIRNPGESHFEGANWDGSRNGHFMVVDDDGEQIYDDDGRGYFADRDDAFELVMKKGGTIEEAMDHYETTDGVTKNARKYKNDGAIIRQVVDDGGGSSSYYGEPNDLFVAFEPNQVKSADFNEGDYSVDNDDIRFSVERTHTRVHEFEVSTRTPYAKATKTFAPEDARANLLISDFAAGLGQEKWLSAVTDLVETYPNYRAAPSATTPEKKLERMVRQMVDNLLWLHDQVPAATRARSKLWYDGARAIAERWVKKYSITDAQAAGMLAVLSPQKDWFMNVSLANRVADIMSERQAFRWSKQMDETASRIFGKEAYDEDIAAIRGETLQDIDDPYLRAMWVRVYDQAHNPSSFYIVSPEGDFIAEARTKDGTLGRVAWGGNSTIAKAVSIFEDGSLQNISDSLGRMHKVRNFYNNILVPNSPNGHVTIDTHAVAAALLRALSGNSLEVKHNFSGPSSAHAGLKGSYALYEEAYRRAAAERGILPREMQSITWEAIRGLYVPTFKAQKRNVDAVDAVWEQYSKGRLSYEKARQQVFELGGRIDPPSWEGRDPGAYVEDEEASDDGDLAEDGVPAGDAGADGGGAGRRAGAAARRSAARITDFDARDIGGILEKTDWAILTAENPRGQQATPEFNEAAQKRLRADLRKLGAEFRDIEGSYGQKENSIAVAGITEAQAIDLGRKYDQDSILTRKGLIYQDGSINPTGGVEVFREAPEDFYSRIGDTIFRINIDFDTKIEPEAVKSSERQTETAAFKKWFGDSKVVDADGKPLVVYHGTAGEIKKFKYRGPGRARHVDFEVGSAFFFSNDPNTANWYADDSSRQTRRRQGAAVYPVYLSMQNPLIVDFDGTGIEGMWEALDEAKRGGHDGLIALQYDDGGVSDHYIPFSPEQIKSATGNRGTFDPASEDITKSSERDLDNFRKELLSKVQANAAMAKMRSAAHEWAFNVGDLLLSTKTGKVYKITGRTFQPVGPIKNQDWQPVYRYQAGDPPPAGATNAERDAWDKEYEEGTFPEARILESQTMKSLTTPIMRSAEREITIDMTEAREAEKPAKAWIEKVYSQLPRNPMAPRQRVMMFGEEDLALIELAPSATSPGAVDIQWIQAYPLRAGIGTKAIRELQRMAAEDNITLTLWPWDKGRVSQAKLTKFYKSVGFEPIRRGGKDMIWRPGQEVRRSAERPWYYSQLSRAIEGVPARLDNMAAPQWSQWLKANASKLGVKQDEITWSGIEDFLKLKGKEKVSKEEIGEYLSQNGAKVEEVVLGGERYKIIENEDEEFDVLDVKRLIRGEPRTLFTGSTREEAEAYLENISGESDRHDAKYAQYTLPGGSNYREVLLKLPEGPKQSWLEFLNQRGMNLKQYSALPLGERRIMTDVYEKQASAKTSYKSSHWDTKNVLAHIRLNDRVDAEGRRTLFVEELQSDWGSAARKDGIQQRISPETHEIIPMKTSSRSKEPDGFGIIRKGGADEASGDIFKTREEAEAALRRGTMSSIGVPAAPFIDDTTKWLNLALKRIIKMAVDEGYDKVAFVSGDQSAERYDLSKQISRVALIQSLAVKTGEPVNAGMLIAYDLSGKETIGKYLDKESDIEDLVGKEVAKRLLESKPKDTKEIVGTTRRREIKGLDLKVGGEGMKAFYDQIVPQAASALVKKMGGGALETVKIRLPGNGIDPSAVSIVQLGPNDFVVKDSDGRHRGSYRTKAQAEEFVAAGAGNQPQPGFSITPAMREKASGGMPLFSRERAAWTDARIDDLIDNYAYTMNDAKTKAYAGWVSPVDFLAATTPADEVARLEAERKPLDAAELAGQRQPIVLFGELSEDRTWKVDGHEGRHRMMALRDVGVRNVPVVFKQSHGAEADVVTGVYVAPQRWGDTKAQKGFMVGLTPISYKFKAEIKRKFGGDGDVRFSRERTNTPEFKAWFGNSKVVDEDGAPLEVYHATAGDFSNFIPGGIDPTVSGPAIWLTDSKDNQPAAHNTSARTGFRDGTNVMPLYVKMERPLLIDDKQMLDWAREVFAGGSREFPQLMSPKTVAELTKDGEYDGIIFDGPALGWKGAVREYIVFDGSKVKSVFNDGTFGPGSDILRSRDRTVTPEFKAWSGGAPLFRMGETRAYKSGEPVVVEALHGTTNAGLSEFSRRRANIESDFGASFYASNTPEDVATNYANISGPDLTAKRQRLAERIVQDLEDDADWSDRDSIEIEMEARRRADAQLTEMAPNTLKLYLRFRNPAVVGGKGETFFDYSKEYDEESDSYGEPTGKLVDFVNALDEIGDGVDLSLRDLEQAKAAIWEAAEGEGLPLSRLAGIVKEKLVDAYGTESGDSAGSELLRQALQASGFDGVIDTTVSTKFKSMKGMSKDTVHFIAFEPSQLKSATGNDGSFDETDPNILSSAERAWATPGASKFDDVVYKMQDKQVDLKRIVGAVKDARGEIRNDLDTYLQEELFHGRAAKRTEDFVNKELQPLVDEMAKRGLTIEDLDEYLHARHAPEANRLIAERNPDAPGLQDGGSGLDTAFAEAYMADLPADRRDHLAAAAAMVDKMLAKTRKLVVDYELEGKDTVNGWGEMFDHYVPLMREDDGDAPQRLGTGQGFSIKGREVKSRTGSTKKVVDILANIAMQRERTIVRGEKNRVAQSLVGLASANPNKDFWTVDLTPTTPTFDHKKGVVVQRPDPMFKARPNVVVAKILEDDGSVKEHAVIFSEKDGRALRTATAMKNLDAAQLEGLMGASATVTRYFAAVNTQYNPVFGIVNLVRDVQGALINLQTTELAGKQKEVAKNTLSALRGIYADARAVRGGKSATSAWASLWEDFQDVGGQTGFRQLFATSNDRAEAIQKALNPDAWMDSKLGKIFTARGTLRVPLAVAMKGARWIFDWLSDYNLAMENGIRLATYKAGLDAGMSKERAASVAKNLTVNFNRKGQIGQQAGAVYAFFNASMQGTARLGQVLFDMEPGKPKTMRLSSLGKKVVYGGITLGSMQALALAAAGFDDNDPPDFARERALIIPTGGKTYVSIPMPLGFHVIPGIGRMTTEWALSGFKDTPQRMVKMLGMFADTFNPIGNAGLSMQTLAPTALDPLVALTENKDWQGRPIAKESMNKAVPGHALARDTATAWSRLMSEAVNAATGGNEYVAGAISPTPDQIDYLIGQITGGVGRELSKVEQTAKSAITGEELPLYKIPVVGRFAGNSASQASEGNAFYANSESLNKLETEIKGLQKDGKMAEAAALRASRPDAYLMAQANLAERQIAKLRKQKSELVKDGAPRERVRAIEEQITARMAALNRAALALRENAGG